MADKTQGRKLIGEEAIMGALYESDVNVETPVYVTDLSGTADSEQQQLHIHNNQPVDQRAGYPIREEAPKTVHRRRRWTHEEKKSIVRETEGQGMSISAVARKYGIAPRLLFAWRRQLSEEMALTVKSGAKIVPVSVVRDLEARIKELEESLRSKQEEVDALTKAVDLATNAKSIDAQVSA